MRASYRMLIGVCVVLVIATCGPAGPPRYGVTSFRAAGPFFPGVPEESFQEWRSQNLNLVLVDFVSGPGSFAPARFALKTPEGGVAGCQFYQQQGDRSFVPTAAVDPGSLTVKGPVISQIQGDLRISLLFAVPGQPAVGYTLTYSDESGERTYPIVAGAIQTP